MLCLALIWWYKAPHKAWTCTIYAEPKEDETKMDQENQMEVVKHTFGFLEVVNYPDREYRASANANAKERWKECQHVCIIGI